MAECSIISIIFKLSALHQLPVENWQKNREDVLNALIQLQDLLRIADLTDDGDLELESWTKAVVDVSLELEDTINEYMIHLIPQGENGYLTKIVHSFRKTEAQNKIAAAMERFTCSIKSIPIPKSLSNTDGRLYSSSITEAEYSKQGSQRNDEYLVGMEAPKKELTESLTSDVCALQVISIVGMGGLGKTTLARQVYSDPKIKKHFQIHAWINISEVFQVNNLLENLIEQLYAIKKQPIPPGVNCFALKKKVNAHLKSDRYVIVIDGLRSIEAWQAIKHAFPNNNCGSRILITTRNDVVDYTSCISQTNIYKLNPLLEEESWNMFCKKTFNGNKCPDNLTGVSRRILQRCFGIPIAIGAISGVLQPIAEAGTADEWEYVYNGLSSKRKKTWTFQSTFKALLFSYNDLPRSLKSCYTYLSLFPENQLIERTRLIRLWIAEGLVEEKKGIRPEDVAESYFTNLLNRNLIQIEETTSDGRVKTCRVHDLLREIISMKSNYSNFVEISEEGDALRSEKVRRLSIRYNLPRVQRSHTHRVRSFLMFEVTGPLLLSSINTIFSGAFKLLTVLDLKGAAIAEFPPAIVKLFHLRYLSLRDTKIKSVPNSVGNLQQLETFDIKNTAVCKLPNGILKLRQLRNLLLYSSELEAYATFSTKHGFEAPKRFGKLTSLQKLCIVKAGQGRSADIRMREVAKLSQLRKLGVSQLKKENIKDLCSSLSKLLDLEALSIACLEGETMDMRHLTAPPKSLQRLYLNGQLEGVPSWLSTLQNLVKIFLKSSKLQNDPTKILENLPNLVHVELLEAYNGSGLFFKAGTFGKLKILGLHKLNHLEQVTVEDKAICSLERLVLQDCQQLKTIPTGIEHLSRLKKLDMIDMPQELIDMIREDTTTTEHIPEVNMTHKVKDDVWKTMRLSSSIEKADSPEATRNGESLTKDIFIIVQKQKASMTSLSNK